MYSPANPSYLTQSWRSKVFAEKRKRGKKGGREGGGLTNRGLGQSLQVEVRNTALWDLQGCGGQESGPLGPSSLNFTCSFRYGPCLSLPCFKDRQ